MVYTDIVWTHILLMICGILAIASGRYTLEVILSKIPWDIFVKVNIYELILLVFKTGLAALYGFLLILPLFFNAKSLLGGFYSSFMLVCCIMVASMSLLFGVAFLGTYFFVVSKVTYLFTVSVGANELLLCGLAVLGWYLWSRAEVAAEKGDRYVRVKRGGGDDDE